MSTAYFNPTGEFVGIHQTCRLTGRSVQWVQRLALIGKIRTMVEPGLKPRFSVEDLDALKGTTLR